MPTPTRAKPPVPAWIIRERKRLGLKPRDLAERLSAAGLPVTEGTVRTWEAGRNPHPDNVEGLERIFGTRSPDYMDTSGQTSTPGPDVSAYLQRIDALVGSVSELVGELRAAQRDRDDLRERVDGLMAAATLLAPEGSPTDDGKPARQGKAE